MRVDFLTRAAPTKIMCDWRRRRGGYVRNVTAYPRCQACLTNSKPPTNFALSS